MEAALKEFLIEREAITAEVLNTMVDEKIDMAAIAAMGEDSLKRFIPKLGDRIATLKFCTNNSVTPSSNKRLSLMERLRKSQQESQDGRKHSTESVKSFKISKRAPHEKSSRIISIGWVMNGKSVREKNGGGTRSFSIDKNAKKQNVLQKGLHFFFPNDVSAKYGPLSNYTYDLLDFKQHTLDEQFTVGQMYQMTGLNLLRFYLSTNNLEEVSSNEEERPKKTRKLETPNQEEKVEDLTQDHQIENETNVFQDIDADNLDFNMNDFLTFSPDKTEFFKNTSFDVANEVTITSEDPLENSLLPAERTPVCESFSASKTFVVHRGQIFKELTDYFTCIENLNTFVEIEIMSMSGVKEAAFDGGGVFKDALTEYWSEFYEALCEGSSYKIPEINHMFTEEKWKAIAKVLLVGFKQVQYFPVKLARPFVEYAVHGAITSDLHEAHLSTIPCVDADVLRKALLNFNDIDADDIMETLSNLDCHRMATKDNFRDIVSELAHMLIIQKPMFILDCWSSILRNQFSQNTLRTIYDVNRVTNKSVLALICATEEELSTEKEKVLGFMKKFIREADSDVLTNFLRFATGADIITCDSILIEFNQLEGAQRRPISHTCNNIVELPVSYDSYRSFKSEFNSILKSGVWSMDII